VTERFGLWLLAFVSVGSAMRSGAEQSARERQAQALQLSLQPNARFSGTVERVVAEWPLPRVLVRLDAAHSTAGVVPFHALAVVNLSLGTRPPEEGARLLFRSRLHAPRTAQFLGDFDGARVLGSKGIDLTGSVSQGELLLLEERPTDFPGTHILSARKATRRLIRATLPEDAAALTEAFVLGGSTLLDDELRRPFDAAGAAHLLAVSGLQATLLASLLFALLRWLWAQSETLLRLADPGPAAALFCLPAIFGYAAYAGGAASVMRSAWMAAAVMGAQCVRRKGALVQLLAAAAIMMLTLEPRAIDDAGFLLSFLSVMALALIAPGVGILWTNTGWKPWERTVMAAVVGSGVTWLATLPLVAHLFGRVALWGALTNVLLVPLGALVLPWVVIVTLLATATGSGFLMELAGASSLVLRDACAFFSELPHALINLNPAPSSGMAALGVLGAMLCGWGRWRTLAAGALCMGVALLGGFLDLRSGTGALRVWMAPVGQGDGAIVITPDGDAVVVDAGGSFISNADPGKGVMLPILRRLGVERLRLAILSHPHPDHQNGMVTLIRELRPMELWWNGQRSGHPRFRALMDAAEEAGTTLVTFVRRGAVLPITRQIGGATFTVLHPFPEQLGDNPPLYFPEFSENDNSLVVHVAHGETAILFSGDIEAEAERLLTGPMSGVRANLAANVLKLPHHGSITSTSEAFLDAVRPEHALIGVGVGNPWGFPNPEVMARLHARNIQVWRTDEDGLIEAVLDGSQVHVSAFRRR
jgi:competence protein ComEC